MNKSTLKKLIKEEIKKLQEVLREAEEEEEEEEEHQYPATAEEYANQLNSKYPDSPFKLVADQEYWEKQGVYSGGDLARYLAVEGHQNAYKDVYGVRPRHYDYSSRSIEQIKKDTNDIYDDDDNNDLDEEKNKWQDKLPGGLADKKEPKDFDPTQLAKGIKVELEHTNDKALAKEIAMDHLTEDPLYYEKLEKVEAEQS